jgi:uncharacterized repeat protein (TIGR03806 family)
VALLVGSSALSPVLAAKDVSAPYGLNSRPSARACLLMPERDSGAMPRLLSQTGAFKDTRSLTPSDSLIPYDINFSFWSDGASKLRWIAVPNNASSAGMKIGFAARGEWTFPQGTVFVKHFELATDETCPGLKRRLETRLIVRDAAGSVYGVTYKWRPDNSDADLLTTNLAENILIVTALGTRTQTWYYPSRQDCRTCHTDLAGGVLGVKTRQLNREFVFPNGIVDNELRAWNHIGLFAPKLSEAALPRLPKLAPPDDPVRTLEDRARSYLDANCAHCHRPGGTVAYFDARYDTPLPKQGLINGPVRFDQGLDRARVVARNDLWRSVALLRIESLEGATMPPLAHNVLDEAGVALLRQWIQSLPGPKVLAPPMLTPAGGRYPRSIEVTLGHSDAGVTIRYTLDGSVPTTSDPLYERPIQLTGPTTVRAKAFKPGFTRSITTQQTFIIGD